MSPLLVLIAEKKIINSKVEFQVTSFRNNPRLIKWKTLLKEKKRKNLFSWLRSSSTDINK